MSGAGLWRDFQANGSGRVIHKWKHYFPIYERHFSNHINKATTFIEIGCGEGGSLQMWKRFLGPHAQIVGIDIEPRCKDFEDDQIAIRIGSQDDLPFLQSIVEEFGAPDIILDDGSHIMSHVMTSFKALYGTLTKNGIYAVEDLHTAYWSEFEGGLARSDTFIEFTKRLVDELNADHTRGALEPTDFTRCTNSICFYDSMIVFERGRYTEKSAPAIGQPLKAPSRGFWR